MNQTPRQLRRLLTPKQLPAAAAAKPGKQARDTIIRASLSRFLCVCVVSCVYRVCRERERKERVVLPRFAPFAVA